MKLSLISFVHQRCNGSEKESKAEKSLSRQKQVLEQADKHGNADVVVTDVRGQTMVLKNYSLFDFIDRFKLFDFLAT